MKLKVDNKAGDVTWSITNLETNRVDKSLTTKDDSTSFMLQNVGNFKINATDGQEYDFVNIQAMGLKYVTL